jgi:hypothetical protein
MGHLHNLMKHIVVIFRDSGGHCVQGLTNGDKVGIIILVVIPLNNHRLDDAVLVRAVTHRLRGVYVLLLICEHDEYMPDLVSWINLKE